VIRGAVDLDLWFNSERFELGCQTFGALAFLFGALAFLFGLLTFLFSAQAFPLYRGGNPGTMCVVEA
jgi:hypothetical protein